MQAAVSRRKEGHEIQRYSRSTLMTPFSPLPCMGPYHLPRTCSSRPLSPAPRQQVGRRHSHLPAPRTRPSHSRPSSPRCQLTRLAQAPAAQPAGPVGAAARLQRSSYRQRPVVQAKRRRAEPRVGAKERSRRRWRGWPQRARVQGGRKGRGRPKGACAHATHAKGKAEQGGEQ